MGSLTVVYDTNVFISGIGFGGKPWRCLLHVFVGDLELLTSEPIVDEFRRVLGYERLPFTDEEQERFPELLEAEATVVSPAHDFQVVDDPDDDKFLECAVAGDADFIVSGDPHLSDIREFRGIPILEPAEFLTAIEG